MTLRYMISGKVLVNIAAAVASVGLVYICCVGWVHGAAIVDLCCATFVKALPCIAALEGVQKGTTYNVCNCQEWVYHYTRNLPLLTVLINSHCDSIHSSNFRM